MDPNSPGLTGYGGCGAHCPDGPRNATSPQHWDSPPALTVPGKPERWPHPCTSRWPCRSGSPTPTGKSSPWNGCSAGTRPRQQPSRQPTSPSSEPTRTNCSPGRIRTFNRPISVPSHTTHGLMTKSLTIGHELVKTVGALDDTQVCLTAQTSKSE